MRHCYKTQIKSRHFYFIFNLLISRASGIDTTFCVYSYRFEQIVEVVFNLFVYLEATLDQRMKSLRVARCVPDPGIFDLID